MQTVVGLYRSIDEANKAKQALLNEGYSGGDISVIDQSESNAGYGEGQYATSGATTSTGYGSAGAGSGVTGVTGSNRSITDAGTGSGYDRTNTDSNDTGVGAKIKHFFQDLTGHDEHTHRAYTEGVSRGGALVAVNVSDGETDRAAGVLRQCGATDIEGDNGSGYGSNTSNTANSGNAGYGNTGNANITGEQVIPVVEEELQVGKRQVERGGVRVYSRVVSEPVTESVNLHEERVVVDRHAVNRAATDADFKDAGPIEVRAMSEEAVVGKTGRVVEEVVIGKTATDRTQTVNDSVRRTEVDVEQLDANSTVATNRLGDKNDNF